MSAHLLFLWCIAGSDLESARYQLRCQQDNAFRMVDAGPLASGESCADAMSRYLPALKGVLFARDNEFLNFKCEAPK